MKNLIVCKFGGSSLADKGKVLEAAHKIKEFIDNNKKVIVVVSAQGNKTDELTQMAYQFSNNPNRRELDMLLTSGERVSISLMSLALESIGVNAISFTGSQAGLFSDNHHGNARIIDIKPIRVTEELNKNKVVVVAGFQAVNPTTKEITTLGRGGSDTTAIALAAHFNAEMCYMFKDVDGIATIDPKLSKKYKTMHKLSFGQLKKLAYWGANVIHYRSIALAKKLNISIGIGKTSNDHTLITTDPYKFENNQILALNVHERVLSLSLKSKSLTSFTDWCTENKIPFPQILASNLETDPARFMITGDDEILVSITKLISNSPMELLQEACGITLSLTDSTHPDVFNKVLKALESENIDIQKTLHGPDSLAIFISPGQKEMCLKAMDEFL